MNGVAIIQINPEIVALKIAAGTLPLAIPVIATEDDTVDGKAHK